MQQKALSILSHGAGSLYSQCWRHLLPATEHFCLNCLILAIRCREREREVNLTPMVFIGIIIKASKLN